MKYELQIEQRTLSGQEKKQIDEDLKIISKIARLQELDIYNQFNDDHIRVRRTKVRNHRIPNNQNNGSSNFVYEAMDIAVENNSETPLEHPIGFRKFYQEDLRHLAQDYSKKRDYF